MSVATTAVEFRLDMWVDINQISDTTFLRYFNDGRDLLIDKIIEEKEDYFYNYIETNVVIWQNEYLLAKRWDEASNSTPLVPIYLDWFHKVKWVSWKIKSTDANYTKLDPKTIENLDYDIESYDTTSNPFYLLQDNSIFIYPAPLEISPIKFYGIMYPKKLALTDVDTLPDQYTKIILHYIKQRLFESQSRVNEALVSKQEFESWVDKVCLAMSWRIQTPVTRSLPNLNYLK